MRKLITILCAVLAGLCINNASLAAEDQALNGQALFMEKTCWACHGKDAKTPILPIYPKLAGQNAQYALQQMKDIKSGARNNGQTIAMKTIMHLVTEEEMTAIAEWVGSLAYHADKPE